jgi:SAM-dependent methyltransferase
VTPVASEDSAEERARHWDQVWREREPTRVSWHQPRPGLSLRLIETAGLSAGSRVLDVGGGASTLVDRLLDVGYRPGVLDVSDEGLARARARLGTRASQVEWFHADVTRWDPPHPWDLWHDRATLHFLTEEAERQAYRVTLLRALRPGGYAVIAEFGPEGPTTCSGLPVRRWSAEDLEAFLGPELGIEERAAEEHVTPAGGLQQFLVTRLRRMSPEPAHAKG